MKTKNKVKKENQKITKDMTFAEVIQKYPQTAKVFLEAGMHCVGCVMAQQETIEQGAQVHGLDVDELVEKLNKVVV